MASVLRAAGVRVVEYPGWRDRRASGAFAPKGVMWHHDASAPGPSPGLAELIAVRGNGPTPPPLAQCWVDIYGVWHLCASGRANHAGIGGGWGVIAANQGNRDAIGVETDHTIGEKWPTAQLSSLRRGTRALLDHLKAKPANALCGHLEYAPGRKSDPAGLDMAAERRIVAALNLEEDDMQLTDRVDWDKINKLGPNYLGHKILGTWQHAVATRALTSQVLAAVVNDPDITPDELNAAVDRSVAAHTPTAQEIADAAMTHLGPLVGDAVERAVAEAAGRDNAELAALIVANIGAALTTAQDTE